MQKVFIVFILYCIGNLAAYAQHSAHPIEQTKHHELRHFRAAILIGHTLIPQKVAGENFLIPSWGIDLEYWFGPHYGLGLHNDIEIETFAIQKNEHQIEAIERVYPLVSTIDLLYKPWGGLVLQSGLGVEFEQRENFFLYRAGIEYEIEFNHAWDFCPTLYYDLRFDNYHTWSFALGIARHF